MMNEMSSPDEQHDPAAPNLTRLLQNAAAGDRGAADELLPRVYEHLRGLAQRRLRGESPGHTLQATALVHETYLRLISGSAQHWESRAHFFHAASTAMRRILIEHARRRGRKKRGGAHRRLSLDVLDLSADESLDDCLALDAALTRLEAHDPQSAGIVRLRFFAGLSVADVADVLQISERSVKREWAFARAWLYRQIRGETDAVESPSSGEGEL